MTPNRDDTQPVMSEANAPIPAVQSGAVAWGHAYRRLAFSDGLAVDDAPWTLTREDGCFLLLLKGDPEHWEVQPLFASPQSEPLPGGVGEAMRKAIAVVLDAAWGEGLNEVQLDEEKHVDAILAAISGKEQSNG